MKSLNDIFKKDFNRSIETVIKADDREHIFQEVDEYVITKDVSKKLATFFEAYNDNASSNGVWISGFFGSGKSHLLKILSYVLENKQLQQKHLGELFAEKVTDDVKLKADILNATKRYSSESILFNIDQQAQITSKNDGNAILQVFYKVFYDHQGFYGFQPHIADFETYLSKEGKYEDYKSEFEKAFGKSWVESRLNYVARNVNDAIAVACGKIYKEDSSKYDKYLNDWKAKQRFSIEDFALRVNEYIASKGNHFRLNFFVDEVGQYIAENTNLMLNLQTITESLMTKCNGNAWVIVTSQEDLETLVGDDAAVQSNDFAKIQGRFKIRMPLTSANVDEVIEKRLLEKNTEGEKILTDVHTKEGQNIKTLLTFSEAGIQFKGYKGDSDFVSKYPFIPYQFDLFQQCIKALSRHNVFQGKHQSVGERSMLGVFQEVLKNAGYTDTNSLVSFDRMFEGLRATLRTESQNSIYLAENQLGDHPLAIRILKVLFLIKYFDGFKATTRNVSVLLLDSLKTNPVKHQEEVEKALNLLEQQTYIQRSGEIYEYLTDDEKNVENEIKNTSIDAAQVSNLMNELIFDGIIKDTKIKYNLNKQEFEYTRKVDGLIFGREKELKIEVVSPNSEQYKNDAYFNASTMADQALMLVKLPEDKRLVYEVRMALRTEKYIRQNQSASNKESVKRILFDKGLQNRDRKQIIQNQLNDLLGKSSIFMNGVEHKGSNSSDGKIRIIETTQDLIQLAFPKLQLLGSTNYDETQLRIIMNNTSADLFGGDDSTISSAEREVLNFIERRKMQHDRTNLSDIRDHFGKKPYGWTQMAVWCVTARLFRRGKIEGRQDTNSLDDSQFYEALSNNRYHQNTMVSPQIELDKGQINLLKQIHSDAFNESNPYNEAKEVVGLFKDKAREAASEIQVLLGQSREYPFVKSLEPLEGLLKKILGMDYATLITEAKNFEDDLLNDKENKLDPIRKFMVGEQKKIYDRMLVFLTGNQANFDYIDTTERRVLNEAHDSAQPFYGNVMQDVKRAMDTLADRIQEKIQAERELTLNEAKNKMLQLQQQEGYDKLSASEQDTLCKPFREIEVKAKEQKFIANLMQDRQRLADLFTDQLNLLSKLTTKTSGGESEPKDQFINLRNVEKEIRFDKTQLKSADDVNEYLEQLKIALMEQIEANRKITLS
jgi:hypothetical protein